MLEFNVNNQIITRKDNFQVVADSCDYLEANFAMSGEWSGAIVAVFCGGDKVYHCSVSDGTCKVPHEVIKAPGFSVSLFCSDNRLVTANVVWVDALPSGYCEGTEPSPPSPELWQQYMERMSLMIESGLPYIGDDYCWYLFNPEKGDYECTGIKAKAETPVKGRDYWTEEDKSEMVEAVLDSISDEAEPFVVEITTEFSNGQLGVTSFTADYDEVLANYNDGKQIVLKVINDGIKVTSGICYYSFGTFICECYRIDGVRFFAQCPATGVGWYVQQKEFAEKDYVNQAVESANSFVVRYDAKTRTSDKTFNEILEAAQRQKRVVLCDGHYINFLAEFSSHDMGIIVGEDKVDERVVFKKTDLSTTDGIEITEYILYSQSSGLWEEKHTFVASNTYVDGAIGDIETALENIIEKYGLGGDAV